MAKQPLGITVGEGGTGVYEHEAGIETFQTDTPYLLADGVSLAAPLPVHFVDGPVFFDSYGNPQTTIPVRPVPATPPVNTVAPSITGTPTVGQVLTVTNGTWIGGG